MKLVLIRNTAIKGTPVSAGERVEVDESTARALLMYQHARKATPEDEPIAEVKSPKKEKV